MRSLYAVEYVHMHYIVIIYLKSTYKFHKMPLEFGKKCTLHINEPNKKNQHYFIVKKITFREKLSIATA